MGPPITDLEQKHHLVILVHGIRTRASWMGVIRSTLTASGFAVEPTNYGRFDLLRFLLPGKYFRRQAIDRVWIDIQRAMQLHPDLPVSFIAHSFGTLIVANLLQREFLLKANRVIFCGSVVHYRFPFEQMDSRFKAPVLNEVGTRDVWPIMAESITWGYGSAGAYGFNRAGVDDRRHNGLAHSDFLNANFCKEFWVPYLCNGIRTPSNGDTNPEGVPWWLELISFFRVKYLLLLFIAFIGLWYWCRPLEESISHPRGLHFLKNDIEILTEKAGRECPLPCKWLGFRHPSRQVVRSSGEESDIAVCTTVPIDIVYRDPATGLQGLSHIAPCLEIDNSDPNKITLSLNRSKAKEVRVDDKSVLVCGMDSIDNGCEDEVRKIWKR